MQAVFKRRTTSFKEKVFYEIILNHKIIIIGPNNNNNNVFVVIYFYNFDLKTFLCHSENVKEIQYLILVRPYCAEHLSFLKTTNDIFSKSLKFDKK